MSYFVLHVLHWLHGVFFLFLFLFLQSVFLLSLSLGCFFLFVSLSFLSLEHKHSRSSTRLQTSFRVCDSFECRKKISVTHSITFDDFRIYDFVFHSFIYSFLPLLSLSIFLSCLSFLCNFNVRFITHQHNQTYIYLSTYTTLILWYLN